MAAHMFGMRSYKKKNTSPPPVTVMSSLSISVVPIQTLTPKLIPKPRWYWKLHSITLQKSCPFPKRPSPHQYKVRRKPKQEERDIDAKSGKFRLLCIRHQAGTSDKCRKFPFSLSDAISSYKSLLSWPAREVGTQPLRSLDVRRS